MGPSAALTSRFDEAFRYAHDLHRDQRRKGTTVPYISHLMAFAALVVEHGGDEDQAIAALLHDAAEDQGGSATLDGIERRFGAKVAEIVSDCTDAWPDPKPEWRARNEAYLAKLSTKPKALLARVARRQGPQRRSHPLRLPRSWRWAVGAFHWGPGGNPMVLSRTRRVLRQGDAGSPVRQTVARGGGCKCPPS
jgi:hypothetical protein